MRNVLVLSVGGAVIVGAVALYLLFGTDESPVQTTDTNSASQIEEETKNAATPFSGTDSMQALLARGENLECTVEYQIMGDTNIPTHGSYFTSRGRMRGDFVMDSSGIETLSSVIIDNDTIYSWTEVEGKRYGMKMTVSEFEAAEADESTPDAQQAIPMDAAVEYDCKPWVVVDGSIFEPPTDLVFTEFSAVMNAGMEFGTVYEGSAEVSAKQCASCDELEGAAAVQCRTMLACE
jgi:hypothetical protein